MDNLKVCTACNESKPLSEFPQRRDAPNATYRAWCKACKYRINQERYGDKIRSAVANWSRLNKDKRNASSQRFRERNPERYAEIHKSYRKRNLHLAVAMNAANACIRKAGSKNVVPSWSIKFFVNEAYALARLRKKLTGIDWHVDHIVPIKSPLVCGLHAHTNLQVIPASQNIEKTNKMWPDMP